MIYHRITNILCFNNVHVLVHSTGLVCSLEHTNTHSNTTIYTKLVIWWVIATQYSSRERSPLWNCSFSVSIAASWRLHFAATLFGSSPLSIEAKEISRFVCSSHRWRMKMNRPGCAELCMPSWNFSTIFSGKFIPVLLEYYSCICK